MMHFGECFLLFDKKKLHVLFDFFQAVCNRSPIMELADGPITKG